MAILGYTNRANIESFLGRTFPEVSDIQFEQFISQAEAYINNYTGYNAETTASGILTQSITREKTQGKLDAFDNLVIDVMHPPIHFDSNNNPLVSKLEFNLGGVRVNLQLTDGTGANLNTILEVSENRRKIIYPSIYFFPAVSTVTPTAKVNLYNLRDVKFYVDANYIGGYDIVPADITAAANFIAGDFLTRRDNNNFANSVSQGSYRVEFGNTNNLKRGTTASMAMHRANELLQPYIRYTW